MNRKTNEKVHGNSIEVFYNKNTDKPNDSDFLISKNNETNVTLFKWLTFPKNIKYVRYRFLIFIFGIIDRKTGSNFYLEQLKDVYFQKKNSFYISFEHLVISDPLLSIWVTDEPESIFKIFKETCEEVIKDIFHKPNHQFKIFIRLNGLPVCESLRNLKRKKPNCLIKIRGYVMSKTPIFPTISFFKLTCLKCLETQETLFSTTDSKVKKIKNCFNCKSIGPFQTKWDKLVSNKFQKISIREDLKNNSFRWLPYSIEVVLTGDLINFIEYGDKIEVTGILKYSRVPKSYSLAKFPSFFFLIEGNSIQKIKTSKNFSKISFLEIKLLEKATNEHRLLSCLLHSFIPHIFKNYSLKLSILLTVCSSGKKNLNFNEKIRNSINMLIIGDSCSGKSKILKSIFNFFPRSHFLTGYGSSIKGLTAYLKYDKIVGQWIPEGGSLTFSKEDLCLIDGLEGMISKDISSICKILDQQYISFNNKPNFKNVLIGNSTIATLTNLNVSENPSLPFFLNYGLDESLISKFDIIYRMEENKNLKEEKNFIKFLLKKFQKLNRINLNTENFNFDLKKKKYKNKDETLSENFVIRYLDYCRTNFTPKYGTLDQSFILKFYLDLKRETRVLNSISFSSNFLETIIRLISSSAKMHLRNYVTEKDIAIGLLVFFESWTIVQPYFTGNFLRSKYKKFFINILRKYTNFSFFLSKNWFRWN